MAWQMHRQAAQQQAGTANLAGSEGMALVSVLPILPDLHVIDISNPLLELVVTCMRLQQGTEALHLLPC